MAKKRLDGISLRLIQLGDQNRMWVEEFNGFRKAFRRMNTMP